MIYVQIMCWNTLLLCVFRNYTLHRMPVPVYDASVALRSEPQRTEQALQTVNIIFTF